LLKRTHNAKNSQFFGSETINVNNLENNIDFNKYSRKIVKKINRDSIGIEKLKQSLREVIAFKLIKIEELMQNYFDFYIKDKNLHVVLDSFDLVNKT